MTIDPKCPRFADIDQYTSWGAYHVNVEWTSIELTLESWEPIGVELDPDFQRGHVWDERKQVNYVEFILKGGRSSRDILFNCPGWHLGDMGRLVLVDGKQRLEAVRKFMRNDLKVFGQYRFSSFTDHLRHRADFIFHVNDLSSRAAVLEWYLQLNAGGVVHTEEELARVKKLLLKEKKAG